MSQIFTPLSSSLSPHVYCNICYAQYNMDNNQPLLICHRNHSICKQCLKSIKQNLRCPFCRENVRANYIRLNKTAVEFIKAKQKSKQEYRRKYIKVIQSERIPTNNDEQELVVVSDLIQDQRQVPNISQNREDSTVLFILIFVELIFLQLPFGIFTFYYGLKLKEENCFGNHQEISFMTYRNYLLVEGYIDCLVGFLTIYFIMFYHFFLLRYNHLVCFFVLLLILVETKSSIFAILYFQLINGSSFLGCSLIFKNFSVCNACSNVIQVFLGLLLLNKLSRHVSRR